MMRKLLFVLMLAVLVIGVSPGIAAQEGEAEATPEVEMTEDDCPETLTYYIGIGNAYFNLSNYAQAIASYDCALLIDPAYVGAYVDRGYAYAALADYEAALADYDRALQLDETSVTAYNNRGLAYAAQGTFGLAISDFGVAVSLQPDYAIGYHNRAVIHATEGNYDLAMADFQAAIDADPSYAEPHAGLAAVYSALAAQQYDQFFEKSGGIETPLPAGTPAQVMTDVVNSRINGSTAVWLRLLDPARPSR